MALSPVIGLDIGTYQMKAVELHPSGKEGMTITNIAIAPTPPGVIQNNILTDPRLMGQSVRQMLKEAGFRTKKVFGCVSGKSSVVVRIIEVPKMSPTELAETMKWEVERHVPFAPSEVQMDYQPLPDNDPSGQNPNMAVLLAVAQKEMINNYVSMIFAAGLDPIAIDIEPLAVGRGLLDVAGARPVVRAAPVVDEFDPEFAPMDETIAIVNIGHSNTDISIFENGQLIFPRSLSLAGEFITRQISDSLGYTADQAEQIKRESAQVLLERVEVPPEFTPEDEPNYADAEANWTDFRPSGLPDSGPILQRSPFDADEEAEHPQTDDSTVEMQASTTEGANTELERTQPIPRRTLDLARRFQPQAEAHGLLGGLHGGEETVREQVFEAILPVLTELATELRRSLDYYKSRSPQGRNVEKIFLCGGTASLPNLDQFLSRELQIPVEVANPFGNMNVTTKHYDADYLATIGPLFAVAAGLACRPAVFAANPDLAAKAAAAPAGEKKSPFSFGKKKAATTVETTGDTTLPPV